ncbi:MAG: TIGR04076 family protein [Candidatus Bathyarchaeota archaeon]
MKTRLIITVEKIRGNCPLYKTGDRIVIDEFYIKSNDSQNVCIHAFAAMTTLLSAFLHGSSAVELGIGSEENIGYLQCPDPGPPCTKGGTVLFKLKREPTK